MVFCFFTKKYFKYIFFVFLISVSQLKGAGGDIGLLFGNLDRLLHGAVPTGEEGLEEITPEMRQKLSEMDQKIGDLFQKSEGRFDTVDFESLLKRAEATEREGQKKAKEKIKSNNTLLFKKHVCNVNPYLLFRGLSKRNRPPREFLEWKGLPVNVGLYKGDIAKIGLRSAGVLADTLFYRKFMSERVDHILNQIVDEPEGLLELLESVVLDEKASEYLENSKGFFAGIKNLFRREYPKVKALRRYIDEKHNFLGLNPFNKDALLVPLALRFIGEELGDSLDKKLEHFDWTSFESYFYYEKGDDGELHVKGLRPIGYGADGLIISPVTLFDYIIKQLLYSSYMLDNFYKGMEESMLTQVSQWCGLPGFLVSSKSRFLYRAIVFWLSVKAFDSFFKDVWLCYVLDNRDEFVDILKEFRDVCGQQKNSFSGDETSSHDSKRREVREKLRSFIADGHKISSVFPFAMLRQFGKGKFRARAKFYWLTMAVVWTPILWKFGNFAKDNWGDIKEFLSNLKTS